MRKCCALALALVALALVALLYALAGCASPDGKQVTAGENFSLAYSGVDTMNPVLSQASVDHNVLYLTQAQLVRLYGGQIQCDAAENYEMSSDATVYTFHLRDGLKWSDGVALTAYDFEYGVYCLLAPEMGSPRAGSWSAIKNARAFSKGEITDWNEVGVKVMDDETIVFTLEYPLNSFDKTIACKHIYPLRKKFVESVGVDKLGSSADTLLCAGPYIMKERVLNTSIELVKNDLYWDAKNSFPTKYLHLLEIKDPNTQVAMFENGEVDAIAGIASQYNDYLANYAYKVIGGGFEFLWFNEHGTSKETAALLSNVNFRQALSYGLNRETVCLASNSANQAANYIVDPSFLGTSGGRFINEYPVEAVPLSGDVNKAKEYLNKAMAELGYTDVSQLPSFSLVTFPNEVFKIECETIIDQWKQNLGIKQVKLTQYEVGTAIDTFYHLNYDIFCISWETDVRPTDIMQSLMTGGEANAGIWSDKEFDQLVIQAVNEPDFIKKAVLTKQAEQLFMDDAGMIPLYAEGSIHAVQHYVSGYQVGVVDGYEFNHLTVNKKADNP